LPQEDSYTKQAEPDTNELRLSMCDKVSSAVGDPEAGLI